MPLQHPLYDNPDMLWAPDYGLGKSSPRTHGELKATLLDRSSFVAEEMTFASSHKKIIITAESGSFGAKDYRAISFTLAVDIDSGIYLFNPQDHGRGPIQAMSYIECVEREGRTFYHLNQAAVGTLHLSVIESCYSARLFTLDALDHQGECLEVCGDFKITPPHATFC